ncbi:Thymidylate kinase [Clostridiales bacterium CHKCI006]|nr:Thymidylate kinase [Clostridiales bacterium CHKCI006]
MLEKVDLSKNLSKKEYKEKKDELTPVLSQLQRDCKRLDIPVIIAFEGWEGGRKGILINKLIQALDPRGFKVYATDRETEDERMHPFLWRFWTKTPAKGRMAIFDKSWYRRVLDDSLEVEKMHEYSDEDYNEIVSFEQQLSDDGTIIIKFFLHISKKEQGKRLKQLDENQATKWMISEKSWRRHRMYQDYLVKYEEMFQRTDSDFAPWHIVEAEDENFAAVKIMSTVVETLSQAVADKLSSMHAEAKPQRMDVFSMDQSLKTSILAGVDLSKTIDKETYKTRLNELQNKIKVLHNEIYLQRIPVVLAFEGWDAGGKGGAIKRLTEKMDPRGYAVVPTASPNDIEKAHHYLWRFWNEFPKDGHIAIFDRTWYGRVMVERIEGFATEDEWTRAYKEMNDMELQLAHNGTVILKFWLHIDPDEQERRFNDRMANPEKQWKITDEDWRNRAKWHEYEIAVDDMLLKTSTSYAPWIVVEANSKYYARIKVLETVVHALEEALDQRAKKNKRSKK